MAKDERDKNKIELQKAFESKTELTLADFDPIVNNVTKLPSIFKKMLFDRIIVSEKLDKNTEKIPK